MTFSNSAERPTDLRDLIDRQVPVHIQDLVFPFEAPLLLFEGALRRCSGVLYRAVRSSNWRPRKLDRVQPERTSAATTTARPETANGARESLCLESRDMNHVRLSHPGERKACRDYDSVARLDQSRPQQKRPHLLDPTICVSLKTVCGSLLCPRRSLTAPRPVRRR